MNQSRHASLQEIPFPDRDFDAISQIAKSEFGLHLDPSKKTLIRSRLSRRLRALGLGEFSAYCDVLRRPDTPERDAFISALTTNVTHFFREPHHFDYLEDTVLPKLISRARAGAKIRLWSAGCSTGQEPYSMAGVVLRGFANAARYDLRILATDVDPQVLSFAEKGTYRADECRFPDTERRALVFGTSQSNRPTFTVLDPLRELIAFRRLNLVDTWPMQDQFDVIFCRNVAIYFDKDTQARLWSRFATHLAPGGILFIGHSERVHGAAVESFETIGVTAYRRRAEVHPGSQATGRRS